MGGPSAMTVCSTPPVFYLIGAQHSSSPIENALLSVENHMYFIYGLGWGWCRMGGHTAAVRVFHQFSCFQAYLLLPASPEAAGRLIQGHP